MRIWTDPIGSIRALPTESRAEIKYIEYDALGNITPGTKSEWNFPLGFAGGLTDFYIGFDRFGFRGYDPQVGRFTAKDPIGDTGGDHDLWDYCVDDPVSISDPSGLFPPLLAIWAGKVFSLAIGGAGAYGAAKVVDEIKSKKEGKKVQILLMPLIKLLPRLSQPVRPLPGGWEWQFWLPRP